MSEEIVTIPFLGRPLRFIVNDQEPDSMILDEIIVLNRYQVFWPHLSNTTTVLDIGAHKGFFTVCAASTGAHVTAYEPNPVSCSVLIRNLKLNGLEADVHCGGVWDKNETRQFAVPQNSSGCAGTINADSAAYEHFDHFEAPCYAFNEIAAAKSWFFMKMDVEGAEVEIINSASEPVLRSILKFGMELHGREESLIKKLAPIFHLESVLSHDTQQPSYLYGGLR